jgi:hypothetical protein
MDKSFRSDRSSWVHLGVAQVVAGSTPQQDELENTYWTDETALVLEAEQDLLDEVELRRLQAALLHPSVRTEIEQELAAVQLCQSQKPVRAKESHKKVPKVLRADRAANWRTELARKRDLEGALWPSRGKATSARAAKKHLKKALAGKLWTKASKSKVDRKALKDKEQAKAKAAAAPPTVPEAASSTWAGQRVRVTLPTAGVLWQNTEGTVKRLTAADKAEVFLVGAASVKAEFSLKGLVLLDGTEKPPLAPFSLKKLLGLEKAAAIDAAGGELRFVGPGDQLEHPELAVGWELVKARGRQCGDNTNSCLYFEPAVMEVVYHTATGTASPEEAAEHTAEWTKAVNGLLGGRALIVVPIREAGHWTLLLLNRSENGQWAPAYYDSLPYPGSGACRRPFFYPNNRETDRPSPDPPPAELKWTKIPDGAAAPQPFPPQAHTHHEKDRPFGFRNMVIRRKAEVALTVAATLLPTGSCSTVLPDTQVPFVQPDAHSCGFYCLARMEEAYSQFRGQKHWTCYKPVAEIRKALNAFIQNLLAFKRQQDKKTGGQTANK